MSYIGTTKIGKMYLGNTEISKAYLGSNLVFQSGGPVPPPAPVLPEGYTALEYIENPLGNSAYIDTGIIPNNNIGFEIDWMSYDDIGLSNYGCIMGSRYASNTIDFQISSYAGTTGWSGSLRLGGQGQNYNAALPAKNTRFSASLPQTFRTAVIQSLCSR